MTRQAAFAAVFVGAMLLEYTNAPLAFVDAPITDTAVGRWLRDAPEPGAVAYLPLGMDRENTPWMVEALQHGRPIVNGYSGQRPASYTGIVESLATLPGVEGRAMLHELGVRFVVSPVKWDTGRLELTVRGTGGVRGPHHLRGAVDPRKRGRAGGRAYGAAAATRPGAVSAERGSDVRGAMDWRGVGRHDHIAEPSRRRQTTASGGRESPGVSKRRRGPLTGCRASSRPATSSRRSPPATSRRCCT